jgi:hypothetical protein
MRMLRNGGAVPAPRISTFGNSGLAFDSTRFDTYSIAGTTSQYQFFKNGQSQKTPALTNMEDNGQFPSGVAFLIQQIGIRLSVFVGGTVNANDTMDTVRKFIDQSSLTMNVVGFQNMGTWPLVEWFAQTSFQASTAGNSPIFSSEAQWKNLRSPIPLQPRALFSLDLAYNTAPTGTPGTTANDSYASVLSALDSADVQVRVQVLIKGMETRRGA